MLRRTLGAAAAALLAVMLTIGGAAAQDSATPAPDCPATSEENMQVVQQYFDAVQAGDTEAADALLSDDFQHDLSTDMIEVTNDPGNTDELERIEIAAEANLQVNRMIAQDDWVAVDMQFDLTAAHLELEGVDVSQVGQVEVMAFVRVDCGEIAEAHFTSNILRALLQHGFEIVAPGE